jgi:GTP-binding protein
MMAIEEADLVIFVVDGRDGLTPSDQDVADILRRSERPVLVAVNKVDGPRQDAMLAEFYGMSAWEPIAISAAHGRGIDILLEHIVEGVPRVEAAEVDETITRVALVGRPNVGKSTMTNRLLGEDRMIVDSTPGTTRDAIDAALSVGDREYVLVDTAGLRRSRGIDRRSSEGHSVVRTLRAVDRCHVAVLLLDATEGITEQDARIAGLVDEKGRGLVVVVNKWDAIERDEKTAKAFAEQIELKIPFVHYAPVLYLSGLTGLKVPRLLEAVDRVRAAQQLRIGTGELNRWLDKCLQRHQPPIVGHRRVKLYFATQVSTVPPTIMISCNHVDGVHFSYQRYLVNQFRDAFDVLGTPVRLVFRTRGERREEEDEA